MIWDRFQLPLQPYVGSKWVEWKKWVDYRLCLTCDQKETIIKILMLLFSILLKCSRASSELSNMWDLWPLFWPFCHTLLSTCEIPWGKTFITDLHNQAKCIHYDIMSINCTQCIFGPSFCQAHSSYWRSPCNILKKARSHPRATDINIYSLITMLHSVFHNNKS